MKKRAQMNTIMTIYAQFMITIKIMNKKWSIYAHDS